MGATTSALLLKISSDTAELQKGLAQAKSQVDNFAGGLGKIKDLIAGAFAVGAIIGAGKALFSLATDMDDIIGKVDDLGVSMNATFDAAKAKAISDVLGTDLDKTIAAANTAAKQVGISFSDALTFIQKGLPLAGVQQEKYLKTLETTAASYAQTGGKADQFFAVVTNGYRTGANFEQQLKDGVKDIGVTFEQLASQMNEGQTIQQKLIDTTRDFNAELANLFDGTGDVVDTLKTNLLDLGLKAFRAIKTSVIEVSNYFIELYNNSGLFRIKIQGIVLVFKELWEVIKLVVNQFINGFSTGGKIIAAIFKGEFGKIPDLLKENFNKSVENFKTFGTNSANNFVDAANAVLTNKKIKLFENNPIDKGDGGKGSAATVLLQGNKTKKEKDKTKPVSSIQIPINLKIKEADFTKLSKSLEKVTRNLTRLQYGFVDLGQVIQENIQGRAVGAMDSFSSTVAQMAQSGQASLADYANAFIDVTKATIAASLSEALANAIRTAFNLPFPLNIAAAGIATAAVNGLFAAIPSFATGTDNFAGGLAQINEKGGEIVNLPSGSQIIPHDLSKEIINSGGGGLANLKIEIVGMLRGEDIYYSQKEVKRRRNI